VRPSNFTESIAGDFVSNGVASLAGRFPHPTSPISVHDLGQIAARCVAELGPSGRVHDLFGPETMSFPDVIRRWAGARHETGLVAKAYQAADLNLINKQVLNLVTPEDLNSESQRALAQ